MALWQQAVGEAWNKGMQRQFEILQEAGADETIEQWRQRRLSRMFSLRSKIRGQTTSGHKDDL